MPTGENPNSKMTINEGVFNLPLKVESKAGIEKVLATKDTYVDKNIKVNVSVDAVEFNDLTGGAITATAGTTDTTYTQQGATPYAVELTADASAAAAEVTVKTPGFADASDKISISAADATQAKKTVYIKEGSIGVKTAGSVEATADGGIELGTASTTKPTGYSIKVASTGEVGVTTAGWVDADNNDAVDVSAEKYYAIAKMAVGNAATTGVDYTEVEGPALISRDYLYINAGYTEPVKIALADLVPDEANVKAGTDGNSHLIYNTVKVYDKDGNLVTGTMGDATLSDITASNVAATITTVTVGDKTGGKYAITGTGSIAGDTSVAVATTGYATTELSKEGTIEGTANLNSTINAGALKATADTADVTVKPVIAKATGTALSGDISTIQPGADTKYIAVNAAAIAASATVTAAVDTEGYVKDETAETTVTAGTADSDTFYVPIQAGSHTAAKDGDATIVKATVTQSINTAATANFSGNLTSGITDSAPTTGEYITITTAATPTAGSVTQNIKCTATEGYISADASTVSVEETVAVDTITEANKYIRVYDGSIL